MKQNPISEILFYIGIFIIGISFVFGIISGNLVVEYEGFDWGVFFSSVVTGFISGMIIIGLSEIIKLLHSMNAKMGAEINEEQQSNSSDESAVITGTWVLDGTDRELAGELELVRTAELIDIIPTPYMRYGIVILEKEGITLERVVDFGGFEAEEVKNKEITKKILAWYDEQKKK